MRRKKNINRREIDDIIQFSEGDTPRKETSEGDSGEAWEDNRGEESFFDGDSFSVRPVIAAGALIVIAAVIIFFIIDSDFIGNYKENFVQNFSSMFENFKQDDTVLDDGESEEEKESDAVRYKTEVKQSVIFSPENSSDAEYAPYKSGVICAETNHMSYIGSDGHILWETDTAIVDPILSAEGNYIMLAEKDRNKICLYSDKKLVYDTDDPDNIKTAKVSSNGDVVAVTDKASYKGGISVYNKTGAQIYSWASGGDAVLSADISSSSRRIAVALLNTEMTAKSSVQLFDLNKAQSYADIAIDDTVIFDLCFEGSTLAAFGDNRLVTISERGTVLSDIQLGDAQLLHSAADNRGNKLLSVNDGNLPLLNVYGKRGALKESISPGGVAGFIDIDGSSILYSVGRDIYFGKTSSRSMTKYNAAMDIKKLIIVSDDTFVVVYSNSMEIVTV